MGYILLNSVIDNVCDPLEKVNIEKKYLGISSLCCLISKCL